MTVTFGPLARGQYEVTVEVRNSNAVEGEVTVPFSVKSVARELNMNSAADVRCLLRALYGMPITGDPLKAAQRLADAARALTADTESVPVPDVWPPTVP